MSEKAIRPFDLTGFKQRGEKLVCLTAYDFLAAEILDESGVDLVLVGDSLANVVMGHNNTFQIGMPEIIHHLKAVSAGVARALLVADLPFLSYQVSAELALQNAGELMRLGAKAVKLEGSSPRICETISRLVEAGIPVIGHIGYMPQSDGLLGERKVCAEDSQALLAQALALQAAGVCALVIELIPRQVSKEITEALKIPTIGIGCGEYCDGQILVLDDMLGKTKNNFRFLKRYAELRATMQAAVKDYAREVKESSFPSPKQSF